MKIKRPQLKFLIIFCVVFASVQRLIPVVFPYGGHAVLTSGDQISGLLNPISYLPYLIAGAVLFIPVGWPLSKLAVRWVAIHAVLFATLLGVTLFPYDIFELGVIPEVYQPLSYFAWLSLLTSPWAMLWHRTRLRKRAVRGV